MNKTVLSTPKTRVTSEKAPHFSVLLAMAGAGTPASSQILFLTGLSSSTGWSHLVSDSSSITVSSSVSGTTSGRQEEGIQY